MEFLLPIAIERNRFHPPSRSYAVIVKDINSEIRLPIMIGTYEAQSIAMALEKVGTSRPMTHDLITTIISDMDYKLVAVHISDLVEGVFYSRLVLEDAENKKRRNIDCRPSDAIAIAIRLDAPMMVAKHVIDEAGYEEESVLEEEVAGKNESTDSISDLEIQLENAVQKEDYEEAAKLRDKIRELNVKI